MAKGKATGRKPLKPMAGRRSWSAHLWARYLLKGASPVEVRRRLELARVEVREGVAFDELERIAAARVADLEGTAPVSVIAEPAPLDLPPEDVDALVSDGAEREFGSWWWW